MRFADMAAERESAPAFVVSPDDLKRVQHVMDLGFVSDPTVQWILDTPEAFAVEHHQYVAMCAEPAFAHGGVHAIGDFDAAAIWYPPGVGISDEDYEAFTISAYRPDRLSRYGEILEQCEQYRPTGPHWTLELVAVDPAAQGRGVGAALMRFGLARCDQTGLPSFLVSSNAANLSFYQRLGFEQAAEIQTPGLPTLFPMTRPWSKA